MKNIFITLLLLMTFQTGVVSQINNKWIVNDLIAKWEGNKTYTLNLIKTMPEKYYGFKPTKEMRSFKGQISHTAEWLNNHFKNVIGKELPSLDEKNKESILKSYTIMFNEIIKHLKKIEEKTLLEKKQLWFGYSSKLRSMSLMDNHLAHHRGQMIVYFRLKGIKPPSYIGW